MELSEAVAVTRKRRDWLTNRIEAKLKMSPPWDVVWDTQERDAHTAILEAMERHQWRTWPDTETPSPSSRLTVGERTK